VNVERVDRERILRGWTQRKLARSARVDPGTLSDLRARRRRPTFGTVQSICTALNLTLAEVITFPRDGMPERSITS
jgi:transcriptional regulator with XRE-family HTH domain